MDAKRSPRWWGLFVLLGLFLVPIGLKALQEGWFAPHPLLELNDQPALVFFTLSNGCECQMVVVAAAEVQLAGWAFAGETGLNIIRVDFDRRLDLARQYGVVRALALVLLDAGDQVVWMQNEGLSDEAPLDMEQVQREIETLTQN